MNVLTSCSTSLSKDLPMLSKVTRDENSMGTVRDPATNEPMIEIPREIEAHCTLGEFVPETAEEDVPLLIRRQEGLAFSRR